MRYITIKVPRNDFRSFLHRLETGEDPPIVCYCNRKPQRHKAKVGVCKFDYLDLPVGALCKDLATGKKFRFPGRKRRSHYNKN